MAHCGCWLIIIQRFLHLLSFLALRPTFCTGSQAPAFTAIKLAAHRDVGAGFSPRPDTYRSLKAAPTGLNLMAVTQSIGTIDFSISFHWVGALCRGRGCRGRGK